MVLNRLRITARRNRKTVFKENLSPGNDLASFYFSEWDELFPRLIPFPTFQKCTQPAGSSKGMEAG
jgi:hypothetical protein